VRCAQSLAHPSGSARILARLFVFPVRCLHLASISGAIEQALDFHAGISLLRQGLHRTMIFVSFSRAVVDGSASAFFTVPALSLASSFA
jgi:hypothetical protein